MSPQFYHLEEAGVSSLAPAERNDKAMARVDWRRHAVDIDGCDLRTLGARCPDLTLAEERIVGAAWDSNGLTLLTGGGSVPLARASVI
jgi:hypothetical protein